MARGGATKPAPAAALLLALLLTVSTTMSATVVAPPGPEMTADDDHTTGRRHGAAPGHGGGGGRHSARPTGLTQCVTGCGSTATGCLLDCYAAPSTANDQALLPVCLLNCTNAAMLCAAGCSTTALLN